ncbi:MAG: cytochrome C [Gammaproteobacteria bacterium]
MVFTTIRCCALAVAMGATVIGSAQAADPERGKQLYDNHCTVCHESQVHIREQRKAKTPADLRWQIARWQEVLKLSWTAAEVDDVQDYLNAEYYHYEAEQ